MTTIRPSEVLIVLRTYRATGHCKARFLTPCVELIRVSSPQIQEGEITKAKAMPFSVGNIVQAALLVANALAILNERRFLRRWGLGDPSAIESDKKRAAAASGAAGGSNGQAETGGVAPSSDGPDRAGAAASTSTSSSNPFYAMDMAERRDSQFFVGTPQSPASTSASGGTLTAEGGFDSAESRAQLGRLLASVRMLLRWPLIVANAICIAFAIIFG